MQTMLSSIWYNYPKKIMQEFCRDFFKFYKLLAESTISFIQNRNYSPLTFA